VPSRTQFFITLDKSPWLERKHTIFGKVRTTKHVKGVLCCTWP
jgi:cyclophilin family peptidyl-prolyl cis-trans isomerase